MEGSRRTIAEMLTSMSGGRPHTVISFTPSTDTSGARGLGAGLVPRGAGKSLGWRLGGLGLASPLMPPPRTQVRPPLLGPQFPHRSHKGVMPRS